MNETPDLTITAVLNKRADTREASEGVFQMLNRHGLEGYMQGRAVCLAGRGCREPGDRESAKLGICRRVGGVCKMRRGKRLRGAARNVPFRGVAAIIDPAGRYSL
jgi:hypothetical protein